MAKPRPKNNAQVRRMFGLAAPKAQLAGIKTEEYLSTLLGQIPTVRAERISMLSFDEANDVIKVLGGDPIAYRGNSVRNQNYRKQEAGVKTIETQAHIDLIHELAALRSMSDEGLESLAKRMNQPWPPQTTEQGNRIVEALKAMNKRDGLVAFPKKSQPSGEPKFRRVA